MKILGAIPARAGSERIPGKNTKELAGKTLTQWAEHRAQVSEVFDKVVISTDNPVLRKLYHETDILTRPETISRSVSIDYDWVKHAMNELDWSYDVIAILRPTSPFRTVETIKRSLEQFIDDGGDSMRAVELASQRPEKMWHYNGMELIDPYMQERLYEEQTKSFPKKLYIQNGCIEWFTKETLQLHKNVSGYLINPFFTEGFEGFDINVPEDFEYAKYLIDSGKVDM